MSSLLAPFFTFLSEGGWTLWVMFGISCLVWARLFERMYLLRMSFPRQRRELMELAPAQQGGAAKSLFLSLQEGMEFSRTMIAALPLLGLLGTVAGMIEAFDALSVFGNSNAQGLSGGISHALISTMVGLVTSLVALYAEGVVTMRIAAAQRSLPTDHAPLEPFAFTSLLNLRHRLGGSLVG